uniref:CHCH domain-containing protein n=1 Tax=Odontella aurita TaxID=265563 RepID=A0A7S4K730_9STRA
MGSGGSKETEGAVDADEPAAECVECERSYSQESRVGETSGEGDEKVECIDCDKSTQKDLPAVSSSSDGMPCDEIYLRVTECMNRNNGQIAPCAKDWDEFKVCHEKERGRLPGR